MKTGFSDSDDRDARLEANDPLWRLLGQARPPEPDAWFTVRTLARCRHAGLAAESRGVILSRVWRWALGSGLAVCVALFLATRVPTETAAPSNQQSVQEAFEIMASIGNDSDAPPASPSSSSWQDSAY